MARTYRVTLNYPDGNTMFVGTLSAEEIIPIPSAQPPASASPNSSKPDTGEKMTDPQKRYLFRLLAAQNVTGKAAEEHLKQYFRVKQLSDIPKAAASEYINQLVKDKKDAAAS